MIRTGTRTRNGVLGIAPDQGRETQFYTRDLAPNGSTYFSGSLQFVNSSAATVTATAANSLAGFTVGMEVLIEGTNLNNGYKTVIGIDTTNFQFLKLSPPPKNETVVCTIRQA